MCGIAGVLSLSMTNKKPCLHGLIDHRGPDSEGEYYDKNAGIWLFHRRLSIIDLSDDAHQPMVSSSGRFVIVFNGEIYNFKELADEFLDGGSFLKSKSDTEVLVNLYQKLGVEGLNHLNGIFALAIWDKQTKTLILARDKVGVKPLYYSFCEGGLSFCSEIKGLPKLTFENVEVNPRAFFSTIAFGHCPGDSTVFKNILKLLPGQVLEFKGSKITKNIHICRKNINDCSRLKNQQLSKCLLSILKDAVHKQTISDAPVGAFLSGGLDSTSVVHFAKDLVPNLQCYTTSFTQPKWSDFENDLPYAEEVANIYNLPLAVVEITPDSFVKNFESLIWHLDEPISDPACITTYCIAQKAHADGVKVLLSGTGADEYFVGYRRHKAAMLHDGLTKLPLDFLSKSASLLSSPFFAKFLSKNISRMSEMWTLYPKFGSSAYHLKLEPHKIAELFGDGVDASQLDYYWSRKEDGVSNRESHNNILSEVLMLDQNSYLPEQLLLYTDKLSMAFGVEVRVPFLDDTVIEFVKQLPRDKLLRNWTSKWLLRKTMGAHLPQAVIKRKKTGFGVPLRAWFSGPLKDFVFEKLATEEIQKYGIFEPRMVQRFLGEQSNNGWDRPDVILGLISAQLWLKKFLS